MAPCLSDLPSAVRFDGPDNLSYFNGHGFYCQLSLASFSHLLAPGFASSALRIAKTLIFKLPLICAKTIIMIKQVKFLGVCVSDQERALRFYTEKLGFIVKTDQAMGSQRWIELAIPGAETGLVLFTPEGQEDRIGSFVNTSLACDDLEATYEELKFRGVEFNGPPQEQPWGKFAILKDPDGNSFVLSSAT